MANEFTVKSWRGNINVVEHDDGGMWDLFDESDGNCLNEGCSFPFKPTTEAEVREFIKTGQIEGKIA